MKIFSLLSVYLLGIRTRAGHGFIHVEVPEECKGKDFCSVLPTNYEELQTHIKRVLPKGLISEVGERNNIVPYDPDDDRQNCASKTKTMSVSFARNQEDYYIIARTDNFIQSLTTVECEKNNSTDRDEQCFNDISPSKLGLTSNCVQIKAVRPFLIYDVPENITKMHSFDVSVYCACVLSDK